MIFLFYLGCIYLILNLTSSYFSYKLLWRYASVWLVAQKNINFCLVYLTHLSSSHIYCDLVASLFILSQSVYAMPGLPHTMPDSDEAQRQIFEAFGIHACLQIRVVQAILNGKDVITIAPPGSGKSLTYWMPLLHIKHGITVVATPL